MRGRRALSSREPHPQRLRAPKKGDPNLKLVEGIDEHTGIKAEYSVHSSPCGWNAAHPHGLGELLLHEFPISPALVTTRGGTVSQSRNIRLRVVCRSATSDQASSISLSSALSVMFFACATIGRTKLVSRVGRVRLGSTLGLAAMRADHEPGGASLPASRVMVDGTAARQEPRPTGTTFMEREVCPAPRSFAEPRDGGCGSVPQRECAFRSGQRPPIYAVTSGGNDCWCRS